MVHSKNKGKRGELELSHFLKDRGIDARRAAQYSGAEGESADVLCSIPWLHIEVKRVEKLNLREAYEQAVRDASKRKDKIPSVIHRSNRQPWLITMSLEDFLSGFLWDRQIEEDAKAGRLDHLIKDGKDG